MHNLGDDNELDRISREAAGNFVPPAEANWQALSDELDRVMPVEKKKRRILFYWWLLPALLAGGAAAYWFIQKDTTVTTAKQATATQVTKNVVTPTQTLTDANKQNIKQEADKVNDTTAAPQTGNTVPGRTPVNGGQKTAAKNSSSLALNAIRSNRSSLLGKKQTVHQQQTSKQVDRTPVIDVPVTTTVPKAENNKAKENGQTNEMVKADVDQPVKENTATAENKVDRAPETVQQPVTTTNETLPEQNKTATAKRGKSWSFSLLAGIDKSTVKFKFSGDGGINLGVLAGYHFNNRWSIHTGIIYTQKNYKMEGVDFTAPKGSWVSYYKLDNVAGYCRMFEAPLLARYTVSESAKKSFFLSMGLSSYFMTRENYDYTYYTNTGSLVTRNSAYISTDTHILSILHLSAGFENRISKSWSLLVEPYGKIPLGGVGFGNIRLSSFGLNFSVQHRQPTKK